MEDHIKSRIGGEVTDQAIDATTLAKQLWKLTPLPLTQVDIIYARPRGARRSAPSLHSLCLATISENLHLYGAESFEGVPAPLIKRVFSRIRADRRYTDPEDEGQQDRIALRPDETTVWSMHAIADPEGMARVQPDHILGLPMITTLQHLTPNLAADPPEHPLNTLPKLYKGLNPSSAISFLTTLSLDDMGDLVNDESITSLRYCTHLSVLTTRHCRFTDQAVRFLGNLQLPGSKTDDEGLGLWRLRAWSLLGCWGVSDRSMKMFARWPGLVMLDVRNTSCTDAGIGIFNRTQQALFACANADFQPCTEGLRKIFAVECPASIIVERLSHTLLKRKSAVNPSAKSYVALHIVPSKQMMHPTWLPDRPRTTLPKASQQAFTESKRFVGGGVGQLYGTDVRRVHDEASDFRRRVKSKLDIEAKLDKKALLESQYRNVRREDWDWDWMSDKEWNQMWKRHRGQGGRWGWAKEHAAGKVFDKKRGGAGNTINDIPDREVVYSKTAKFNENEEVEGEGCYMMVRMVCDEWESLVWAPDAGARMARANQPRTNNATATTAAAVLFKLGAQRQRGDLIGDILGTAGPGLGSQVSSSRPTSAANPFEPTQTQLKAPHASQGSSPVPQLPSSSPPILTGTHRATASTARPSNPFRRGASENRKPIATAIAAGPPVEGFEAKDSFSLFSQVPNRKRTFGGSSVEEQKRRGMKMFSGAKL